MGTWENLEWEGRQGNQERQRSFPDCCILLWTWLTETQLFVELIMYYNFPWARNYTTLYLLGKYLYLLTVVQGSVVQNSVLPLNRYRRKFTGQKTKSSDWVERTVFAELVWDRCHVHLPPQAAATPPTRKEQHSRCHQNMNTLEDLELLNQKDFVWILLYRCVCVFRLILEMLGSVTEGLETVSRETEPCNVGFVCC